MKLIDVFALCLIALVMLALSCGSARADWVQRCNGNGCELVWVDYGQAGTVLTTRDAPPPAVGPTMILSFAPAEAQRLPIANGPTVAFPPVVQTAEPPVAVRRVGPIRRLLFWRR